MLKLKLGLITDKDGFVAVDDKNEKNHKTSELIPRKRPTFADYYICPITRKWL